MSDAIRVFEVGPRDGLQNERQILATADKLWLIRSLRDAGISRIEAGSFVRPDRVPQMADSDQLQGALSAAAISGEFYYLVPNLKGLERAMAAGVKHIAVFTAASESFNRKNIGISVAESLQAIQEMVDTATRAGLQVRGYVSTAFGCPFEGRIPAVQAQKVIEALLALPMVQVSIGDTIGVASAQGVDAVIRPLLSQTSANRLAVHFHDTRGTALANSLRSYELGIRTFDSSIGGLGGCPFAPGASGNLATEDLVYYFKEMGVATGIDYRKLCEASLELHEKMGGSHSQARVISSKALQAYQVNCQKNTAWDS